jgi:hypothetical protein
MERRLQTERPAKQQRVEEPRQIRQPDLSFRSLLAIRDELGWENQCSPVYPQPRYTLKSKATMGGKESGGDTEYSYSSLFRPIVSMVLLEARRPGGLRWRLANE